MRDSVVLRSSVCDAVVSQPLASFTHLTKLHLIMPAAADMQLHVLTRSFAVMPQLQAVRIDGFQHGGASELEACFAPRGSDLTTLTCLRLAVWPVTAEVVRVFVRLAWAMESLGKATLKSGDGQECDPAASCENHMYAAVDWCQGLLDLPSRGYYECVCRNEVTPESELEAVKQQLIARGARIKGQFEVISFSEVTGE